jgi:hypothetical protein
VEGSEPDADQRSSREPSLLQHLWPCREVEPEYIADGREHECDMERLAEGPKRIVCDPDDAAAKDEPERVHALQNRLEGRQIFASKQDDGLRSQVGVSVAKAEAICSQVSEHGSTGRVLRA